MDGFAALLLAMTKTTTEFYWPHFELYFGA
jgi:hypothetical protein